VITRNLRCATGLWHAVNTLVYKLTAVHYAVCLYSLPRFTSYTQAARRTRWLVHLPIVQSSCALAVIHNNPNTVLDCMRSHAVLFTRKSHQCPDANNIANNHQNNHEIHNFEINKLLFILLIYKYVFMIYFLHLKSRK
jgi:hypothetical protein